MLVKRQTMDRPFFGLHDRGGWRRAAPTST
jgi:hypothetical protein